MLILILIILFLYLVLKMRFSFYILSPVYLYVIFFSTSIILSNFYFFIIQNKINLFGFDTVAKADFVEVIRLYMISLICFIIGSIMYGLCFLGKSSSLKKKYSEVLFINMPYSRKFIIVRNFVFITTLILYAVNYGSEIFIRSVYLSNNEYKSLTLLIKVLTMVGIILSGLVYKKHKLSSYLIFIILIVLSLGTGSRISILFFLIFYFLLFQSRGNTLYNKLKFIGNLLFIFIIFAFIIDFRKQEQHGIFPYFMSVIGFGTYPSSIFNNIMFNIYYTNIFGVFGTIRTMENATADWNILWLSLNPFPGSFVGFYNYVSDLKLNRFAPFTTHGQVFKFGYSVIIPFFTFIGLSFAYFDHKIRICFNRGNRLFGYFLVLLCLLHIVYSFEYLLRASFRYIYYLYFFIIFSKLISNSINYLPKKMKYENDSHRTND